MKQLNRRSRPAPPVSPLVNTRWTRHLAARLDAGVSGDFVDATLTIPIPPPPSSPTSPLLHFSLASMKLSILMPVYNERTVVERSISLVLNAPLPENMERELVIVDDCSTDGTSDILQRLAAAFPQIQLYRHAKNCGKGAAVRTAPPNTLACCGRCWTATPTRSSVRAIWPANRPASCRSGIP